MNFGNSMDRISETRETAKQSDAFFDIDKRISLDETRPRELKDLDIDRRKDISVKEPGAGTQENRAEDKVSDANKDSLNHKSYGMARCGHTSSCSHQTA